MLRTCRMSKKYIDNYKLFDAKELLNWQKINCIFYSSSNSLSLDQAKSRNLYRHLYSKILSCGPISVADYMKEVLTHPTAGYYMNKDVFGEKGDFTTSPEITQLFGEMIAVWMVHEKMKLSKCPFQIVELGPGRGTLIKDILRVFKQLGILNDVSIHLVEISPALSLIQAQTLCKTTKEHDIKRNEIQPTSVTYYREGLTEDGVTIYWYDSIKDVPKKFSIFLAHEFFDALPIHKFQVCEALPYLLEDSSSHIERIKKFSLQKTDRGWSEVLVDVVQESTEEKFRFVLSNAPTPATVYISSDERRDHVEISPESLVIIDYIAEHLWECGGIALICDYGHNGDGTDTFRAFSRHKVHDPLSRPGSADLTADVDFAALRKIAEKGNRLITFGPVTQTSFLKSLGIDVRLQMLLKNATKEEREHLESGYRMIMDSDKMGTCFKMLSLFPSILKDILQKVPVAGFYSEGKNRI